MQQTLMVWESQRHGKNAGYILLMDKVKISHRMLVSLKPQDHMIAYQVAQKPVITATTLPNHSFDMLFPNKMTLLSTLLGQSRYKLTTVKLGF